VTLYSVNIADRQDLKNNNPVLLRSYLNLISVICSKTVHNIAQTKFKLPVLAYVHASCTKIIRHCNKYIKMQKQSSFLAGLQLRLWDFKKSGLWLGPWARIQTPGLRLRIPGCPFAESGLRSSTLKFVCRVKMRRFIYAGILKAALVTSNLFWHTSTDFSCLCSVTMCTVLSRLFLLWKSSFL